MCRITRIAIPGLNVSRFCYLENFRQHGQWQIFQNKSDTFSNWSSARKLTSVCIRRYFALDNHQLSVPEQLRNVFQLASISKISFESVDSDWREISSAWLTTNVYISIYIYVYIYMIDYERREKLISRTMWAHSGNWGEKVMPSKQPGVWTRTYRAFRLYRFDVHLFLQTATVIDRNKSRDFFI